MRECIIFEKPVMKLSQRVLHSTSLKFKGLALLISQAEEIEASKFVINNFRHKVA